MNREVNEKCAINRQVDMLPLFAGKASDMEGAVRQMVAEELGTGPERSWGWIFISTTG